MTQEREALTAWGDDVALRGPDAPRNNGSIKHMIEYLLTVYKRFGNTTITANLQWGATALWKRDEAQQRVAELEAELEALRITLPEATRILDEREVRALCKKLRLPRYWWDTEEGRMDLARFANEAASLVNSPQLSGEPK